MTNVYEWLDEVSIRKMVLPKIKIVFERNHNDLKIVANVLQCIERTLDKLDKSQVNRNRDDVEGSNNDLLLFTCYVFFSLRSSFSASFCHSFRLLTTYYRCCGRFDCPIQILFFVLFVSSKMIQTQPNECS